MKRQFSYPWNRVLIVILFFTVESGAYVAPATSNRFHSPSGRYDILFEPLADDWTHARKAQSGRALEAMEKYAVVFSVSGSSDSLNAVYFSDSASVPASPEAVVQSMQWSPQEAFVVFQDRPHAAIAPHVFQRVAALKVQKIWDLEADHVHWMDDHRLVGDLNTKDVPGGIVLFDGTIGTADLLIAPIQGIGYQLAGVSGHQIMVKEILNSLGSGKTTWDHFEPACFILDVDSLKKHSAACPK